MDGKEPNVRRAGIICSKTGERLGIIEEETLLPQSAENIRAKRERSRRRGGKLDGTPTKSATFHGLYDLQLNHIDDNPPSPSGSEDQLKISIRRSRKRSLFYEMGERIRLFSSGSFVSTVPPQFQKESESGHPGAFNQSSCVIVSSARRGRTRTEEDLNLPSNSLGPDMKFDVGDMSSSQLGMLCRHCSATDLTCPKAQQEMAGLSPSLPSLYSLAHSDMSSSEPLCRICHCCWPTDPTVSDPLISPCRCSGSLQYVHVSCLMHWLDISSRKLHRPAICELCLYKYKRKRTLKYREFRMPDCAASDVKYFVLLFVSILLMLLAGIASLVCFHLEKTLTLPNNRTSTASEPQLVQETEISVDEMKRVAALNLINSITMVAGIVFFICFLLIMIAHVKSGQSICSYISMCYSSNIDWSIEEYKQSKDSQYLTKLEELRRKINEKQKKTLDEVEPLRSSVIVIE